MIATKIVLILGVCVLLVMAVLLAAYLTQRIAPVLSARLLGAVRSKTIWLNAFGVALIEILPHALPGVMAEFPMLQPIMPDNVYQWLMSGMVIINIVLRFRVRVPLEHKR